MMTIRDTEEYLTMTTYRAMALFYIAAKSETEELAWWQYVADVGIVFKLGGWFAIEAQRLINEGIIDGNPPDVSPDFSIGVSPDN